MIWFLFASHCAVGCLMALALVPNRLTGGGFPRFISGVVLFFLVGSLLAGGAHKAGTGGTNGVPDVALIFYTVAAVAAAAGAFLAGDRLRTRTALLVAAILPALAGFLADTFLARVPPGAGTGQTLLIVSSFLTAALAAGTVCVAMILGHFYLVIPRLPVKPLVLLCRVLFAALLLRLLLGAVAFFSFGPAGGTVTGAEAARFLWQNMAVDEGLIFWPRLVAGLLTPIVLAFMALRTALIRSTQSATGLLYVAVVFTTIGEFLGRFLFLATRLPL